MFPRINPTLTESWKRLSQLASSSDQPIASLFETEKDRAKNLSFNLGDLFIDFSKNNVSKEVLKSLLDLAEDSHLKDAVAAMMSGDPINETEDRAVQHVALRSLTSGSMHSDLVNKELKKIEAFTDRLHSGEWKGYSEKPIKHVVNIGIGGSDLGPKMVTYALKPFWKGITPHFISNVDAQQLVEELDSLDADTTLFIIASKTFTTQETMTNAHSARDWFLANGGTDETIAQHFVAVSTNVDAVESFGISKENMFVFWDWVGGRYSLWSSIGLSIAATVGFDHFRNLLLGAEKMDQHFADSPFAENVPVLAALIGIWYNNFLGYDSQAILPYDHRLRFLPSYLQQADMESNGKYVDRSGSVVNYQTGPIIWGEPGTNGQHAFYQLIHQGTKVIPCDFIAFAKAAHAHQDHHDKLLANFFAQAEALLNGKSKEQVMDELKDTMSEAELEKLLPFKVFEGNRPSTSILIKELNPFNLGMLIAFYEHKIFVQGAIWNIFSFDQWGVELGKQLAKPILKEIQEGKAGVHDASTSNLMKTFYEMRS